MPLPQVELDGDLAAQALTEALARFPEFEGYGPRLVGRPIYQGIAYQVIWSENPPAELTGAWEFQNAAVKAYQRLASDR